MTSTFAFKLRETAKTHRGRA